MRFFILTTLSAVLFWAPLAEAGVSKDLPYAKETTSAQEIAEQVYYVNHFYGMDNFLIIPTSKTKYVSMVVREKGKKGKVHTIKRLLNNAYGDGTVKSRDLIQFITGKMRGTSILITDYVDDAKQQSYSIWLPALRKIRRFSEPPHDDAWGGSDFTYGDIALRKPEHEEHELLGTETFGKCLGAMTLSKRLKKKTVLRNFSDPSCEHKDKTVYKLKSTTKQKKWWYDHRISYVDTTSYADYRTEYYKDGALVKEIDRDWTSLGMADPRMQFWKYWYGKTSATGHETQINIPEGGIQWNKDKDPEIWTEENLKAK
ncbi:MAG: outer membrane lipoprotein-sorting protein [Magnetococcales bacterium]|nr:outer membrane lipoprotein-sorting protein [Magnetococcales bacterium]